MIGEVFGAAAAVAKGMSVTMKEMMSPTVTENYPDEPPKLQERFRGVHVLQRDENGMEKCVACFLCAAACPSNCIYIEAAENTDKVRISGGERYAKVYNIDYNRCIFCGYCVEACPTDAITHGHGFEVASYNTSTLVYTKEDMLAPIPPGAKPPVIAEPPKLPATRRASHVLEPLRLGSGKSVVQAYVCRRSGNRSTPFFARIPRRKASSKSFSAIPASTPY